MASKPHTSTIKRLSFLLLLTILVSSCEHDRTSNLSGNKAFSYPSSKFWAHKVNTVESGRNKAPLFQGLEADINYCEFQDRIFMGHELWDTIYGLTFGMWLDSLPQPVTNRIWLDIKNLTIDNASLIAHHILDAVRRHDIQDHIMVESQDHYALRIVKDSGLHVILWTETPYWTGDSYRQFRKKTQSQIDYLHPDAISGDSISYQYLTKAFPDHNIHIWDTPREENDSNVTHSRLIAAHPSVKVVLVDYPTPPEE